MSRYAKNKNDVPLPKIEKVELSDKHIMLRIFCICLLAVIIVVSFTFVLKSCLEVEDGYYTIEYNGNDPTHSFYDRLNFSYYCRGRSDMREVAQIYSELTENAYKAFDSAKTSYERGVYYLNAHPNTPVEVDPILYSAIEKIAAYDNKIPFFAPIMSYYLNLFAASSDDLAATLDPIFSDDIQEEIAAVMLYIKDPDHIRFEVRENSTVCLKVSDAYASYIQQNNDGQYIDFTWIEEAFVVDYIADQLIEKGYTEGLLSSGGGFTRCLEEDGQYRFSLLNMTSDGKRHSACTVSMVGRTALVSMKAFSADDPYDFLRYYAYENGDKRQYYLSQDDGICKTFAPMLSVSSKTRSCADLYLDCYDLYVTDTDSAAAFAEKKAEGISCIYVKDTGIYLDKDSLFGVDNVYTSNDFSYQTHTFE